MSGNQDVDMYNRVEMAETWRKSGEDLHESSSTAFCVDLLESLFLLSLVDNAESSHEETQNNGHEPIDSGENGIQSVVGLERYGGHTERLRLCDKGRIGTERSAHLYKICSVEVATTLEHILDFNPSDGTLLRPNCVEVDPLAKSEEPDEGAGNGQVNHVTDEQPVQEDKASGDMVSLNNGSDGDRPGNEETNT